MRVALEFGVMHALERRARKLELSARLDRDRRPAFGIIKPDRQVAVADRRPAERSLQALDQRANAAVFVMDRRVGRLMEPDLLVLRPDLEARGRALGAGLEPLDELSTRRDRRGVVCVAGHVFPSLESR